jgi:hypothetical protein
LNEERIARINAGVLSMLRVGSLDGIKSTELERIIFSKKLLMDKLFFCTLYGAPLNGLLRGSFT